MKYPLIGKSKDIERIKELIEHVADTGFNIVISGESGVGKEVGAQNLYLKSAYQKSNIHQPPQQISQRFLQSALVSKQKFCNNCLY